MNDYSQQPQSGAWKIPTLFGVTIALLGANIYSFLQIDQLKTDLAKTQESIQGELSTVRESTSLSAQASQKNIQNLQGQLAAARAAASSAVGAAKEEAVAHADELSAKLSAEQKRAEEQTKQAITQVSNEANAKVGAVSADLGNVKNEVGSVKQDVSNTRADLDKTISGLKSAQGDLGVQSGLIATNSTELKALKELGDRNYFEFKMTKTKMPYKIADVSVLLKSVDPKRNRYTIEVTADDKKFEKKDRSVREPVQFIMSSYRQPYELVVNDITKDQISGYLAQPKVKTARN